MRKIEEKASICLLEKGITYHLCELIQTIDGETFSYCFIPDYEVLNLLPPTSFDGIQGLDLSLHKERYLRVGIPVFLAERVPPENRENIGDLLKEAKLDYYDPLLLFLRSREKYSGDSLFGLPYHERKKVNLTLLENQDPYPQIKRLLSSLAAGEEVKVNGQDVTTGEAFKLLYPIYSFALRKKQEKQRKSVTARKANKTYRGRKEIPLVKNDFEAIARAFRKKEMPFLEALNILGISRSTFFRRCKKYHF